MSIWKNYRIVKKGYNAEFFIKDVDEIRRHHFNDGFDLSAYPYFENEDGAPRKYNDHGVAYLRGISVGCSDPEQIEWYVKRWVEWGILEPVND